MGPLFPIAKLLHNSDGPMAYDTKNYSIHRVKLSQRTSLGDTRGLTSWDYDPELLRQRLSGPTKAPEKVVSAPSQLKWQGCGN